MPQVHELPYTAESVLRARRLLRPRTEVHAHNLLAYKHLGLRKMTPLETVALPMIALLS